MLELTYVFVAAILRKCIVEQVKLHYAICFLNIYVKQTCVMPVDKISAHARIKNCTISRDYPVYAVVCRF